MSLDEITEIGEIWKPINGFEDSYLISNYGNVYSIRNSKIMKPKKTRDGYLHIGLSKNGKVKNMAIHRLVGMAFIPNPQNKPTINHLNEIKDDNRVDNLEWATYREQNIFGTRIERAILHTNWNERTKNMDYNTIASKHDYQHINDKQKKPVIQFSAEGNYINRYESLAQASKIMGVNTGHLCECLKGHRHTCGGFIWKYE